MDRLVTVLLALLLLMTGGAYALNAKPTPAAAAPTADAHPHRHDETQATRDFRLARAADGRVPTLADLPDLRRHGTLAFRPGEPWTPAQGVVAGRGTIDDPYVLDGIYADVLHVYDTDVEFVLRNSYVRRLVLDWHHDTGLVHHNRILSLETNRNVERTGGPSGAVIAHNVIDEVTQLRHFDGVLAQNVIGRPERCVEPAPCNGLLATDPLRRGKVALNVQGFNGAEIRDNVVHGGVDVKLHGHHHDSGDGGSHVHAADDGGSADHADRHHRLLVVRNVVLDPLGFGLRYNDRDHAGDDRQATSEQEPALERPHTHRTSVRLEDNLVDGAPIRIEVFMAPDELHGGGHGDLRIVGNRVVNATARDGILVAAVRGALVLVEGNRLSKGLGGEAFGSAGVRALRFENATFVVRDNTVAGFRHGVAAQEFDAATRWFVEANRITGASRDVWWDETVANPPEGGGHESRDHGHDEAAEAVVRRMLR